MTPDAPPPAALPFARLPRVTPLRPTDALSLVPSRYRRGGESVLALVADDVRDLIDLTDLEQATDDRLRAEHDLLPGVGAHELVAGVPHDQVINAAFAHPHPLGGRWNGPERGAWYAAFDAETARVETAWRHAAVLAEVGRAEDSVTYDSYLSEVGGAVYDLRAPGGGPDAAFAACLDPDSYVASQALAGRLCAAGALGVLYPSVRRAGGTCVACFQPAVVTNVRRGPTYRFTWAGRGVPEVTVETA